MKYNAVALLGDPLSQIHTSGNYFLINNLLLHIHTLSLQHYIPIASYLLPHFRLTCISHFVKA